MLRAVVFYSLIAVAAGSGSDTYNNLFSDLSPLIALFGEQVTKQFLSQSITFADCILFAAAPIGLLTGVVSAIRLGGYAWLRATVGRAAESRAAAGLELTSATSSGICELWDGKSVVRTQGTASILSVLFLDHKSTPTRPSIEGESEPVEIEDREPLLRQQAVAEEPHPTLVDFEEGKTLGWIVPVGLASYRKHQKKVQVRTGAAWEQTEDSLPSEDALAGARNPIPPIPPNIALNASSRPSNFLVKTAALAGLVTQGAVLTLGGLVTYRYIPSDGGGVRLYAFPLMAAGTSLVSLGMTICAFIVVASSRRETWITRYVHSGNPELVWLQRQQVVNDETFPAIALFPKDPKIYLSLAEQEGESSQRPRLVLFGVLCSMVGFVFQFVGLRNLHWSVSVAQLVAMFMTTAIRVFLHMPFSNAMRCEVLPPNFELEWLTNELAPFTTTPHQRLSDSLTSSPPLALKQAILVRNQLRDIAVDVGWESSVAVEAKKLRETIDSVMNSLWADPAFVIQERNRDSTIFTWQVGDLDCGDILKDIEFTVRRNRRPGLWTSWVSSSNDIESVLALWLYAIHSKFVNVIADNEDKEPHNTSRRAIWQIGPMTPEYCMDYDWWIRRASTFFLMHADGTSPAIDILDGVPLMRSSFASSESPSVQGVVTHCSLTKMCCRYLFIRFLEEALRVVSHVQGITVIREAEDGAVPELIRFQHTAIETLTVMVSSFGLFNSQESYFAVVPCLRHVGLMPDPVETLSKEGKKTFKSHHSNIKRMVHVDLRLARSYKHKLDWEQAEKIYSRLLLWLEAVEAPSRVRQDIEETKSLLDDWRVGEIKLRTGCDPQNTLLDMIGEAIVPENLTQRCAQNLWVLDVAFVTGFARDKGRSWVLEVLTGALETGNNAAVLLILLELMDKSSLESIRSELLELTQHTIHNDDIYLIETMLLNSTRGPATTFSKVGCSLGAAARSNKVAALKKLLEAGVPVNSRDSDGYTALMVASAHGHLEVAMQLFDFGAHIHAEPPLGGMDPLAAAVSGIHENTVNLLLTKDASPSPLPRSYGTPLQLAAASGSEVITEQLIDAVNRLAGTAVNTLGQPGGRSALQAAAENNHLEIVKMLLTRGADVNVPAPARGYTALQIACLRGHYELVKYLLDHGAGVNAPAAAEGGLTALQAAALGRHHQIVLDLLQVNARINASASIGGFTAIQAAAAGGDLAVFSTLIKAGANIAPRLKRHGRTVLQAACANGHLSMVEHVLAIPGIDANELPAEGHGLTPLQAAVSSGQFEIVRVLINRGAYVNAEPSEERGRTALQSAAEFGDLEITKLLLDKGAAIDAAPSEFEGFTAVQAASHQGHFDIVKLLCEEGADIHASPSLNKGRTALQAAAEKGHLDIVQYLLEKGAYANERPAWKNGVTAWQVAYANGYDRIAAILAQAGAKQDLQKLPDTYIGSDWITVYPAELPDWTNAAKMERASSPNGFPDTVYYRSRAHINSKPTAKTLKIHGRSPLWDAASAGDLLLIQELLSAKHAVDDHSCIINSRTPLQAAAEGGHIAVVFYLIQNAHANPNAPRAEIGGCTAVEAASAGGHLAVVQYLIANGATVNAEDPPEGKSALQLAAANGHYAVVKDLLAAGADANFVSAEAGASTALQAAQDNGWEQVVELLEDAIAQGPVDQDAVDAYVSDIRERYSSYTT